MLKNSLARCVFSELGMDGLSQYLKGPSAIVWGGEGITELAKVVSAQVKTLKKPEIKGGAVEGVVVGPDQVDDITKLPSREVLIGQVIGLLLGPARRPWRSCRRRRPPWSASWKPLSSGRAEGAAKTPPRLKPVKPGSPILNVS